MEALYFTPINVEVSQLLNLPELLDYQVNDEHPSSSGTYKMIQKSKLRHSTVLIDMGMIWRMATPLPEDQQKQNYYVHNMTNWGWIIAVINQSIIVITINIRDIAIR